MADIKKGNRHNSPLNKTTSGTDYTLSHNADSITSMLSYLSPDERETWVKMAMAVKSELGEDGFFIWDKWSQTSDNYKQQASRAVYKSVKNTGGVGIGSLIHLAKMYGWQPDKRIKRLSSEEVKRRKLKREKEAKTALIELKKRHSLVSEEANRIISQSRPVSSDNAYLKKKKVQAFGLFEDDKSLIIPLRDINGKIWNIQRIYEDSKYYLKSGKVKGLFHQIGEINKPDGVIYCGEGYATMASIFQKKKMPCIVAFSSGNLLPVCLQIRAKYKLAEICVTGDNDRNTKGNPGKTLAKQAAYCVAGTWVVPQFPNHAPLSLTDFNDLINFEGGAK